MQAKRQTFSCKYYCRDSKKNKQGMAPVELSIIVNGERAFVSLPRKMRPKDFEKAVTSRSSNDTKQFISLYEAKVNNAVTEIITRNETLTAQMVKDYVTGNVCHSYTLSKAATKHLELLNEKTRQEITLDCYRRYEITYNDLIRHIGDKELSDITVGDMLSYKTRVMNNHQASTAYGYMARCKSLLKFCVDNKWLDVNPMATMKLSKAQKKKQIPTMEDYKKIVNKRFDIQRLEAVREMFILAASTGLSYSDLMLLQPQDIKKDEKGNTYIEKERKKTGVTFTSVVLKEGVEILDKYNNDITPLKKSDQRLNGYLREVQDICGIRCRLTMHVGRHIYCSRLIQAGVSPAIVQRALGHSRITTTQQFYTHLTTESVIENIKGVN
jgi:site-specific recombinase XerD